MGTYDQRLWLIVRNTADTEISFHLLHIFVEFGSEWCILNVVNRTIKSFFAVNGHSSASCTKM